MKVVLRFIVAFCAVATLSACGGDRWRDYHALTCGTTCNITYRSAVDLSDSITILLNAIESEISVFDPQSPVSALNRGEDIVASHILRRVILASKEIADMSGGACDPTVGPLVELWGFGSSAGHPVPTDAAIDSALATVGIAGCRILPDGHISKKTGATSFNFGAIGKGFAAQEVVSMLRRNGVNDCMVEVGGDLALSGVNARGTEWLLQVDAPVENSGTPTHEQLMTISLSDCGIATSGNYRNYRDNADTGRRYGHTISPLTGRPVTTDVLSATVIAPDAAMADGLATACMVLGSEASLDMASHHPGIEIMLVTAAADSVAATSPWRIVASPGFPLSDRNPNQ
ncbi:MAG: FAD:protein FMN transferase [Muribaculaceae bacterium]|nr:FAD:protein FMN transferase [Muribaculaceae bacterium]